MMEPEDQVTPRPPLLGIVAVATVVAVLVGALVYLASDRWSDGGASFAAETPSARRGGGGGSGAEAETLAAIREQKAAELEAERSSAAVQARLEVNRLLTRVDAVGELVADVRDELAVWTKQLEAALTNDVGKRLAASEPDTRSFAAVWSREGRPTARDAEGLAGRVETIRSELDAVLASELVVFPDATRDVLSQSLDEEEAAARAMLERLQKDRKALEALLAGARDNTPAETTLESTMTALAQQDAAAEVEATLAAERAEREAKEAQEEAEREEATRLRERAQSAEVQALYGAFISNGHYECRDGRKLSGPPTPVSLDNLKHWGVLSDVELFAAFACVRNVPYKGQGRVSKPSNHSWLEFSRNDRTGASDFPTTEEGWAVWEQRRKEFNELVPTFLELGLLRP